MSTLDRWMLESELAILRTNRHPSGADRVLEVLLEAKRAARTQDDEWVDIDRITALTGQRAVHSRVAELRDRGYVPENNGRAGGRSKYRLVYPVAVRD